MGRTPRIAQISLFNQTAFRLFDGRTPNGDSCGEEMLPSPVEERSFYEPRRFAKTGLHWRRRVCQSALSQLKLRPQMGTSLERDFAVERASLQREKHVTSARFFGTQRHCSEKNGPCHVIAARFFSVTSRFNRRIHPITIVNYVNNKQQQGCCDSLKENQGGI